jgi:hypothetical protein
MSRRGRSFGLSFSWRRAAGLSAAQAKISRAIGVPLSRSGRERKLGRMVGGRGSAIGIIAALAAAAALLLALH